MMPLSMLIGAFLLKISGMRGGGTCQYPPLVVNMVEDIEYPWGLAVARGY